MAPTAVSDGDHGKDRHQRFDPVGHYDVNLQIKCAVLVECYCCVGNNKNICDSPSDYLQLPRLDIPEVNVDE